jgi:hypothetical protein
MKNKKKILIAIGGGTNVVFSIFTPIAIALMLIKFYGISSTLLLTIACISSLYRAYNVGFMNE